MTEYDRIAYPSYTHPQTHPDRLAVLGQLFGLDPAPLHHCRVLEVGCGDGTNLAPIAWTLPDSEFVGLDLATEPVRRGQEMVLELGLKNLKLVPINLTAVDRDWGSFDYIIAHGFFSWVPAEAQQHLFKICRQLLNPNGIAFISYNALPGFHLRRMVREMMLFHVRGFEGPEEKIRQAQALLQFLLEAQDTKDEYRMWLKAELEQVRDHAPGHLYHDELAALNQPFYFTQFMEQAASHGLQYLGEADYFEMSDHIFSESTRESLSQLGHNRVLREQYLDFLKCRRFRQTLLCHGEARLKREPSLENVSRFWVGSSVLKNTTNPDLTPGVNQVFETPKGARCQTDLSMGKAALTILSGQWPFPLRFEELEAQIRMRLEQVGLQAEAKAMTSGELADFLLRLYAGGVVELRTWLPAIARQPGPRPLVHPVARWQARRGSWVASLFHIAIKIEDELGRTLLSCLDGTLERPALQEKVWEFLKSRKALVAGAESKPGARQELETKLEENLGKLAQLGLLLEHG